MQYVLHGGYTKKNFYLEILVDMRQMNFDFVKFLFDIFILSFFELFLRSISKHSDILILISIGKSSKQTYQKVKNIEILISKQNHNVMIRIKYQISYVSQQL